MTNLQSSKLITFSFVKNSVVDLDSYQFAGSRNHETDPGSKKKSTKVIRISYYF